MSHTNKTQYYNLPQFIGTDVPAWLTDVNQGYAAIDAGMRAAQVKADNADQTAGQAANDVQALSSTVTAQASQISAAAQAASSAQTTANGADTKADANAEAIGGLDTRVSALEQGGSAGVKYVDIEKSAGAFLIDNYSASLPPGAKAINAYPIDIVSAPASVGMLACINQDTDNISCFSVTQTGVMAGLTAACKVRVFYAD